MRSAVGVRRGLTSRTRAAVGTDYGLRGEVDGYLPEAENRLYLPAGNPPELKNTDAR
jgi:hypothetical protein